MAYASRQAPASAGKEVTIGIDLYLEWDEQPEPPANHDPANGPTWSDVRNAKGCYIRESYHSQKKATDVFVPETFETYPFTDTPRLTEDDHNVATLMGVEVLRNANGEYKGTYIPGKILRDRLPEVHRVIFESKDPYYDDDPEYARDHYQTFVDVVEKVEDLELHDIKPYFVNSY